MNGFQKAVKYIALAFAMFLSVTIIASCAVAVLKTAEGINILTNGTWFEDGNLVKIDGKTIRIDIEDGSLVFQTKENGNAVGEEEMFGNGETKSFVREFTADETAKIKKLNINNYSGKLHVVPGETLRVEAKDVSERYVAEIRNGNTLFLGHNGDVQINFFNVNIMNRQPQITLTIPHGMEFTDADFNIGSGAADVQHITAEGIYFNTGSGKTDMSFVTAKNELNINSGSGSVHVSEASAGNTNINSGSGRVVMSNCNFGDTEVDSGSGSLSFDAVNVDDLELNTGSGRVEFKNGKISGDITLDSSSGGVSIQADADLNDYSIDCSTGSGGVWLNGVKVASGYEVNNSNAHHNLDIDGGSGRVSVELYRK